MTTNVLVGTRKGAWIFSADDSRRDWRVSPPIMPGYTIYHMAAAPPIVAPRIAPLAVEPLARPMAPPMTAPPVAPMMPPVSFLLSEAHAPRARDAARTIATGPRW